VGDRGNRCSRAYRKKDVGGLIAMWMGREGGVVAKNLVQDVCRLSGRVNFWA